MPRRSANSRALCLLLAGLLVLGTAAAGQTAKPPRRPAAPAPAAPDRAAEKKIASIRFTGSKNFAQEQLLAATTLQIGEEFNEQRMKIAAQALSDSGAFTSIEYRYQGTPAGIAVEFLLGEQPQRVSAAFDNFVWFTPQELLQEIRERVPLYTGRFAVDSPMPEQVARALQQVIEGRGSGGRVTWDVKVAPDRSETVLFRVEDANIRIAALSLAGVSAVDAASLQQGLQSLTGTRYDEPELRRALNEQARPAYIAKGHLAVEFGEPQFKVVEGEQGYTNVEITVPVREGRAYRLAGLEWKGSTEFSPEELAGAMRYTAGQALDATQFQKQLGEIGRMYRRRGFMIAEVSFEPRLSPDGIATLVVAIEEGEPFQMGRLNFTGLSHKDITKLREMWRMPEGETYDATYPDRFLGGESRKITRSLNYRLEERLDQSNQRVNLTIHFTGDQ